MPYLIPSRTPLTPQQVERGFDYLLALQTGVALWSPGGRKRTRSWRSSCCGWPRTSSGPSRPRTGRPRRGADSFALDEAGGVLLYALRDWARDSPTTAAPGIARSILRFTANVLPDPDHPDTAGTLEAMRDERLILAHAVHSAPGAHQ
ncbi:hypothetical protein [Streptomyces chrestomyceticus]|uniref:hypothetical protein n=1 Tax=Streptomyces chrestomyceticus TaxID=68185 RepID=UPI0033E652E9